MSRVCHFEIHATDPETVIAFYTTLFGWKFQKWMGDWEYWMIETGPQEEDGINGGLVRRRGPAPAEGQAVNAYVCTVTVESLDPILEKSIQLGATIALPKMCIAEVGWLAYIKDPDGNLLGLMQNDPGAH